MSLNQDFLKLLLGTFIKKRLVEENTFRPYILFEGENQSFEYNLVEKTISSNNMTESISREVQYQLWLTEQVEPYCEGKAIWNPQTKMYANVRTINVSN